VNSQDPFASVSGQYAASRPRYPRALFDWLAQIAPSRERAWDCACGSGQATIDLADYFSHVIGTDKSADQLREANPDARIEYRVALAESSGLPSGHFDLVTVAQAMHWIDHDRFYAEVRRVLRPGGVLAVWCYGTGTIGIEKADAVFQDFYRNVVGPYWHSERELVDSGYTNLDFPQPELTVPGFWMEQSWSQEELLGYVRSWSATARFVEAQNRDPVAELGRRLRQYWGGSSARQTIRWPLSARVSLIDPYG